MSMGTGGSSGQQKSEQVSQPNQFQNVAMAMLLSSMLPKEAFDTVAPYVLPPNLVYALGQSGQQNVSLPPQYPPTLSQGRQPISGVKYPGTTQGQGGMPVAQQGNMASTVPSGAKGLSQPWQTAQGGAQSPSTPGGGVSSPSATGTGNIPVQLFSSLYDALSGAVPNASAQTEFIKSLMTPINTPSFLLKEGGVL